MSDGRGPMSIATYRTKTDLIYEALREAIMEGRYPPGSRIVADQLAEELGTSKVPVREAISRLIGEGWLQSRPHAGAIVPELTPQEIIETAVLRAVVEGAATRHAAGHVKPETLALMTTLAERMEEATRTSDMIYSRLNLQFHRASVQDCPYTDMRSLAISLIEKAHRVRPTRALPKYRSVSDAEHRALLEAMERRDGDAAERITREHVDHAGRHSRQLTLDQR